MIWLAVALWAVAVALACGLAFLFTVGRAFGRRAGAGAGAGDGGLAALVLGPGLLLGRGNPVATVAVAWAVWAAAGAGVIVLLARAGG